MNACRREDCTTVSENFSAAGGWKAVVYPFFGAWLLAIRSPEGNSLVRGQFTTPESARALLFEMGRQHGRVWVEAR